MTKRRFVSSLIEIRLGIAATAVMLPLMLAPPRAGAVDLAYNGPDCSIIYRFTPSTGTLHDLRVIYNRDFSFFPAYYGGILTFELGGIRMSSWQEKHASRLLRESMDNGEYSAKFRWSSGGCSFDFTIVLRLEGKTLVIRCETAAAVQNVVTFGWDRSEDTPGARIIPLPFGHNVLYARGAFISAVMDTRASNSSWVGYHNTRYSETSAFYSQWTEYWALSDSRRHPLKETFYLTVSPNIEDVYSRVANPISPYKEMLSDKVVADLWRWSFQEYRADIGILAALGLTDLYVILHVWQKYGYDSGLPSTYPAGGEFGGDEELREISRTCRNNDYRLALHTNYVDFYPNSDVWNPWDVARSGKGTWIPAWRNGRLGIQSYLLKPSRALHYARMFEPLIHGAYSTGASYLDVHSAALPCFKVDFDASSPGAGKQALTFEYYTELFSAMRDIHEGPVFGEGYGFSTATWAGYIDATEGDPHSQFDLSRGRGGTATPSIPDFKLRKLHEFFVLFGAGNLERFYYRAGATCTQGELERYRATALAFGNGGFLSNPFYEYIPPLEVLRDYCFLKHIQRYYLNATARDITYNYKGYQAPLSDALHYILPRVAHDQVEETLLEVLSMIRVAYDSGLVLYVNRSAAETWDVAEGGVIYSLEPGGFLAVKGSEFLAYTARVNGEKTYYVWPAENPCRGHLSDYIHPPLDFRARKAYNRGLLGEEYIHILTWEPDPRNKDIAKYAVYLGEGAQREFLAAVDGRTFHFWHRGVEKDADPGYVLVAVNSEGREGEAAFVRTGQDGAGSTAIESRRRFH